jgi:hypothetical protein
MIFLSTMGEKERKKEKSKDSQVHDPASLLYYSQHNG